MLAVEAEQSCNGGRYARTAARRDTRAGSYRRKLATRAGVVTLKVAILVATSVMAKATILGIVEDARENKASWLGFLEHLKVMPRVRSILTLFSTCDSACGADLVTNVA